MDADPKKLEKITEKYLDLPEDVQKAMFSSTTSDAIFEIGKKYDLIIDKMGELADETGLVMLGITKPNEFIRNLENRLGVPAKKAKEIAEDINQKVFSPIRESLKKIHGISPAPVTPPPTPPPLTIRGGEKAYEKIIMPSQPESVTVGEIAKEVEPKIDVKPSLYGRIDEKTHRPLAPFRTPSSEPLVEEAKPKEDILPKSDVPNIFIKKLPSNQNDPYKESVEP